jgi:NIPSNAP protein
MVHVLDVAEVAATSLDEYLELLTTEVLPDVCRRGLEVVGCWTGARKDGTTDVVVLLAAANWEVWAAARSAASRDPAVAERARRLRAMTQSATRRFLIPVEGGGS